METLKPDAEKLMLNLRSNGAKIVSVFDGNSASDTRWNTGHELQKENYEKIILEVLNNKELGVIFKPKHPNFLKIRLGSVYNLLKKGMSNWRCIIFRSAYKISVSISCYFCIEFSPLTFVFIPNLSAGTAALDNGANCW